MPTGFKVESGAALSHKLATIAPTILNFLKDNRTAWPNLKPLSAGYLCHWASESYQLKLEGSDVRAIVNYLRQSGEPIGSNAEGYFYALTRAELDSTVQHLSERIAAISKALHGMTRKFTDGKQQTFL
jgi:hypothetical protein